jgi:DNA-binding NtrC family response regulator
MTRVKRQPPALVVIDVGLGDGNVRGATLLEQVRRHDERIPILAMSDGRNARAGAEALRAGASDFLVREPPLADRVELALLKLKALRRWIDEAETLEQEAARFHEKEDLRYHIVGESPQMMEVMRRIGRVAKIPRPVLIVGERGTGKELVARAIHREGSFANGPFVAVNCAALPDTLLESELFGHEKGAFTGAAHATEGKFEQARGGTLFLDEIGNMSLPFQQKILRVVEYHRFTRVGGKDEIRVNTRIVAATNADLKERMRKGQFLPDLHDRLAFEEIRVPALREREGEIEILAQFFLNQFMNEIPAFGGKRLSRNAIELLYSYDFPGNVRELKNIIERAVYRDTTNEVTPEDIGLLGDPGFQAMGGTFQDKVSSFERQLLADALRTASGNRAQAARSLGLRYHQLRHLLTKHGLGDGS